MQYVLSGRELTELAQEVAFIVDQRHMEATPATPPKHSHLENEIKDLFAARGISWEKAE